MKLSLGNSLLFPSLVAALGASTTFVGCGGRAEIDLPEVKRRSPSGGGGSRGATGGSPGVGGTTGSGGTPTPPEPPNWEVTGITTWRHDATAAYTIFHDDTCSPGVDNQFDEADPALFERGLVASFGAIALDCLTRNDPSHFRHRATWDDLETLRSHGHEIANHSYSHLALAQPWNDFFVPPAADVIEREIGLAHEVFEENLQDFSPTYFIFPFDGFNDDLVEQLRDRGYLGARAGIRGINGANFPDDLRINFDVYGPGNSFYVTDRDPVGTPCEGVVSWSSTWDQATAGCRTYIMNTYVDDIIAAGGYGLRELHSLDGEAWEPIPSDEYEAHLDYVVEKINDGDLWMCTASDAIRYRRGREACAEAVVSGDSIEIDMTENCQRFATHLTYEVTSLSRNPTTSITAFQAGEALEVKSTGPGMFQITANPMNGPIEMNE